MREQLNKFQSYLKEKGYANSTVIGFCEDVKKYKAWNKEKNNNKKMDRIIYLDAMNYIKFVKKQNLKPQTINLRLTSLKHYYNYLKIKRNPFQSLIIKGEIKTVITNVLTREELEEMYTNFPTNTIHQKRNKVLFGLYAFQGIYSTEADKINTSHINLQKGLITIPVVGKRAKRTLKLENVQMFDLLEYLQDTRIELLKQTLNQEVEDRLFFSKYIKNDIKGVKAELNKQLRKHFVKYKELSQLRTSVIINWLKEDNLRVVMYKAGHKYISSTERYKSNDITKLTEAILKNHPMG